MEYFELTVLERKGILQDRLFNLMLGEQNIDRIMELSPYTNVRKEAYYFIHYKVEPLWTLCNIPFSAISWMGVLILLFNN